MSASLKNPNFDALYSVNHIGGKNNKKWWHFYIGALMLFIFTYSWWGIVIFPSLYIYAFYNGYYLLIIYLSIYLITEYTINYFKLIPLCLQRYICKYYLLFGSYYFDGGLSILFETEYKNIDRPILASCHPHGIFTLGFFFNLGLRFRSKSFIDNKILLNKNLMKYVGNIGLINWYLTIIPLFSFFITSLTGVVDSIHKQNIKKYMKNKIPFGMIPGGFQEASLSTKNIEIIYIKKRKGFIKYTLQFGYDICPCYTFGESSTYFNIFGKKAFGPFMHWLNKHKIVTIIAGGSYWYSPLFLLPCYNIGIHCIFGKKLSFPKINNPTHQEIDKYHEIYMNEIIRIFNTHKSRFGLNDRKLQVF